MYDPNFEQPTMSGDSGYYDEAPPGPLDAVKKNLKAIIFLIILLAIGFGLYYYFIGSIVEASFEAKDLNGKEIQDYRIQIMDSSKNVVFKDTVSGTATTKLRGGDYSFTIEKTGYKAIRNKSFNLSAENSTQSISLEKITNVSFQSPGIEIPETIFAGQTAEGKITLKNNSSEAESVELVFDTKDAKGITLPNQTITVPGGIKEEKLTISVPSDIAIKDTANGDLKKFTAKINLTNEKSKEVSFKVLPQPNIELSLPNFGTNLAAGNDQKVDVTVTNKNKFEISNVTISIENIVSEKNDPKNVAEWFSFNPPGQTYLIDKLGATNASREIKTPLTLRLPLNAKAETIQAKLFLRSPGLAEPIAKDFSFTIKTEAGPKITATLQPTSIIVPYDSTAKQFKVLPAGAKLTFKNTGTVDATNVSIEIDDRKNCDMEWIDFIDAQQFDLPKGGTQNVIQMNVSAPKDATTDPNICKFKYKYSFTLDDPNAPITAPMAQIGNLIIRPASHT